MRANVQDFVNSFKKDISRPSRFDVMIPIPAILSPFFGGSQMEQLSFRCENAELPGRSFATTERKFGSAPVQKIPYLTQYNDIQLTFIVSGDMNERLFFDMWMELINPSSTYNFRYKTDYVTEIGISQYDLSNNLMYRSVLIDAFPVSVSQLDLDWTNDGYHRLAVDFAYTKWQLGTYADNKTNLELQTLAGFTS